MTTSFELLLKCRESGILSKEAADDVFRVRKQLIKAAMAKAVKDLLGKMKAAPTPPPAKGLDRLKQLFGSASMTPGSAARSEGATTQWSDAATNLAKMMALAGMTAGAASGISALSQRAADKRMGVQIEDSYRQMFSEFPALREKNPNVVRTHFGVLRRYAPSLAADPIVAGSFVQQTAEMGAIHPDQIKMLAQTQNEIDRDVSAGSSFLDRGVGLATKAMSGV